MTPTAARPQSEQSSGRRITNKAGLPEPLVRAIMLDPYDASMVDFSTTTLIKPARIVALERKHRDEITEDASDRIWPLFGQLGHLVLQRAGMGEIVEVRFCAERMGKKIGGQIDLWKDSVLLDYKFTSLWGVKDGVKPEWEQQMNINALLCRENGVEVKEAQVVAIYRDWSVGEARRNKDYPQQQVQVWPVKLWPLLDQEDFVCGRILLHVAAQTELPECTPLERWARPEKWAVMKDGREKAVKLYDSKAEALKHAGQKSNLYWQHRPGVNTRCEDYCNAAPFCEQFKRLKGDLL